MNALIVILLIIGFILGYHCLTNNNLMLIKTMKHDTVVPTLCPQCVHAIETDHVYPTTTARGGEEEEEATEVEYL
uniref:Membrane protein n=1 Tax=Carcinus maenas virus 1 TaxID=2704945 RepID=A0A6G9HD86_9VIRU|nr:membrane protein [Carcinus maenas virus 1]